MLALWLACAAPPTGPGPAPHTGATEPTGATGHTGAPPASLEVTCVPQPDNGLRFTCGVVVEVAAPVEVTYVRADGLGATRTHRSEERSTDHAVELWFLAADQEYTWTARVSDDPSVPEVTGRFVTGGLPPTATVALVATGTSSTPYVGLVSPCTDDGTVLVFETGTGALVWYQELMPDRGFIEGASFTEDHTVLGVGTGQLAEVDLAGHELLRLDRETLGLAVHHDVFRRDGLTYVLFHEPWTNGDAVYLLDGFLVYRGLERVLEWRLSDHRTPPPSDTQSDWSHANAIWADEAGQVYVSLRHLSTVVLVDGDLGSRTVGEIRWQLSAPGAPLASDFALQTATTGPADFYGQHNVHLLPDGRVTMFDNRPDQEISRVVDLRLDEAAGTATIEDEFPLPGPPEDPGHCDFQGGAWRTVAGHPIATCGPYRRGYEFDPTSAEILWEAEARCLDGAAAYLPRFVPLDW